MPISINPATANSGEPKDNPEVAGDGFISLRPSLPLTLPAQGSQLPLKPVQDALPERRAYLEEESEEYAEAAPGRSSSITGIGQQNKSLTAEDLINNDYEAHYARLEEKVLSVKAWLQGILTEQNKTADIAEARSERGKKFDEMTILIDQLLTRYFAQEANLARRDIPTVTALVTNEMLGLGPIEPLWGDPRISEIMVNGPFRVRVEIKGKLVDVPGARFRNREHLLEVSQQMLAPLGRTLDIANPYEDGRLPDGSRINITHPIIGPQGPFLTIRRFPDTVFSLKALVEMDSMTPEMAVEIGNFIAVGCSILVVGSTGSGKLLSHDTLIPTPSGMSTMGELKQGDIILDENSNPTKVTAKYSTKIPVAYELTFSDGTKVAADEDHNWLTETRAARRAAGRQKNTGSLSRVNGKAAALGEDLASLWNLYHNRTEYISADTVHSALPRLTNTINKAAETLPTLQTSFETKVYDSTLFYNSVMGYVSSSYKLKKSQPVSGKVVTTKEIFDTLRTPSGHVNHSVSLISKPVPYSQQNLTLDPYLFGIKIGDESTNVTKFIPDEYLYSSVAQRRSIVAGLLDATGSVNSLKGSVDFRHSEKSIVDGFRQIIHSLGYQSSVSLPDDNKSAYMVSFYTTDNVFGIPEKQKAHAELRSTQTGTLGNRRYITDVQPIESVPMSCITVDSPNSLYLITDAFIPTHNTSMLNALSDCIPLGERVITIEDNLELQLNPKADVLALEARKAHQGDKGNVTIRDLVKNTLRMRPDRIVVGEVRDGSAYDMLQAMNTGHDGSMTTVHANDAQGAIDRLVNLMAEVGDIDTNRALSLIAGGIDIMVVVERYFDDGSRRVSSIVEIPSRVTTEGGYLTLEPRPLYEFFQTDLTTDENGEDHIVGEYRKINDISDSLIRKHRLDKRRKLTLQEIYTLSDKN